MWDILLTLLILILNSLWWIAGKLLDVLWWMTSRQPCSPVVSEEERVKFLLTLLVESRWSGLTYKLLYRHRHHRGLTSADGPLAANRAAAASDVTPQLEIPPTAGVPRCPRCDQPMLMRRNRRTTDSSGDA